jgi:hypothetical protein
LLFLDVTRPKLAVGIDVSGKPNFHILRGKEAQEDGIDKLFRKVANQLPTHPRRGKASMKVAYKFIFVL